MQVCTSLQTDNHASTPPLSFLQAGCPSCRPTNSVKALKAQLTQLKVDLHNGCKTMVIVVCFVGDERVLCFFVCLSTCWVFMLKCTFM